MKPQTLLRLYPRAWREKYGDEFVALVNAREVDREIAMDVARSAMSEWLDHPNLRGGRELMRLAFGFVCGVSGFLALVAAVQAGSMAGMPMKFITTEVLASARGLFAPVVWIWAISMTVSAAVALTVIRLRVDEARPRLATLLVRGLVLVAMALFLVVTSPPFARVSPVSLAMLIEVVLNVYCAGAVVHWAVLVPRQRRAVA